MSLTYQFFSGAEFESFIDEVARLRMAVFREFPYLYDGNLDYEKKYLSYYLNTPDFFIALALYHGEVVGASTALPLKAAEPVLQEPFLSSPKTNPNDYFYFGESVLLPQFRGQGAGQIFFEAREKAGREKGFKKFCFCAVDRSVDHPQRPTTYKDLYSFWQKNGFEKRPELKTNFSWKEIGEASESLKPMSFWIKEIQ